MVTGQQSAVPQNYVVLLGKLERDPAIHRNPQGNPMAVLDLRTTNPETGKNSDFHNMVCFGGLATWCKQNLKAGMRVCIQGQLAMRRWKQGEKWRTRVQVIVRQIFFAPMWSDWASIQKLSADETVPLEGEVDEELGI